MSYSSAKLSICRLVVATYAGVIRLWLMRYTSMHVSQHLSKVSGFFFLFIQLSMIPVCIKYSKE